VAVIGKVPSLVRGILRGEFRKASPDCPVWLDCEDSMRQSFGMAAGVPNLVVIDARSQVRIAAGGRMGREHIQELVNGIESLRREAAGIR
jgi:predicted transcriptional regulator